MNPFTSLKMFVEVTVVVFVNKSQVSLVFVFYCFVLDREQEGGLLEASTTHYVTHRGDQSPERKRATPGPTAGIFDGAGTII